MSEIALFVHFLWQRGVPKEYLQAASDGMKDVVRATKLWDELHGGSFHGTEESHWNQNVLVHADELVATAARSAAAKRLKADQLDVDIVLKELGLEWQSSKEQNIMPFLIVRQDYAARRNGHCEPFLFGGSRPPAAATLSTYRFEHGNLQHPVALFRLMAAREFARLMGAPNEERGRQLVNIPLSHHMACATDGCLMQHGPGLALLELNLPPHARRILLCEHCKQDIKTCVEELLYA